MACVNKIWCDIVTMLFAIFLCPVSDGTEYLSHISIGHSVIWVHFHIRLVEHNFNEIIFSNKWKRY